MYSPYTSMIIWRTLYTPHMQQIRICCSSQKEILTETSQKSGCYPTSLNTRKLRRGSWSLAVVKPMTFTCYCALQENKKQHSVSQRVWCHIGGQTHAINIRYYEGNLHPPLCATKDENINKNVTTYTTVFGEKHTRRGANGWSFCRAKLSHKPKARNEYAKRSV